MSASTPVRVFSRTAQADRSVVLARLRLAFAVVLVGVVCVVLNRSQACPASLNHVMPRLQDEAPQNLCQYAGRVVLVVNTASFCGFTGQYEQLEALYARYAARGMTVLGFPSNDFGQQEPGSKEDIAALCFNTYGVKFPMFSKITVIGKNAHPLYSGLAKTSGQAPRWNFHKYLIDRNGQVVASFPSEVNPLDAHVTLRIDALLAPPGDGAAKPAATKG